MSSQTKGVSSRLPLPVWILSIVGFLIALGFGVMSPVLPVYARTFGVSSFLIGLVVSALSILRMATMPLSSWLMRYIGPREMAIAGNLLVSVTTFMIGVSNSYWGILIWRGLGGFGSALYGVSSMALLFAAVPSHMRGKANALSGGGWALGSMAGPALGGLISTISIHAPFFFYSATLAIASVVMVVFLPRTQTSQRNQMRDPSVRLKDLVADKRFRAVMVMNFANGWQSNGVRNMLIPLFVVEVLDKSTGMAGVAFTIAAIAQALCLPLTGWGTDRLGRRTMLLIGGTSMALVSVGFALTHSFVVLVVLMCVYAIGASASGSSSQAMLADTVPVSAGSGLAAYQMAGDIGTIMGPMVAGAILDHASMAWAWLVGAIIIGIGVIMSRGLSNVIEPKVGERSSQRSMDPPSDPSGEARVSPSTDNRSEDAAAE